jgi:hypothetical protein
MLIKNLKLVTTVGTLALLSVSVASAEGHGFNNKELNGRSSYIGVAYVDSDISDVSYTDGKMDNTTFHRGSNKVGFGDADGGLFTMGNDYGYVRVETEFGYRSAKINKVLNGSAPGGDVDMGTAMVNVALEYSIDMGEVGLEEASGVSLTPYITGGIGVFGVHGNYAFTNTDLETDEGVDNGMFIAPAAQAGVGLTVGLPAGVEVFANYSEMLVETYNYRDSDDVHIQTVSGGLRINF